MQLQNQDPRATDHSPAPFTDELFKRLLSTRRIMLTGEIDDQLASLVCAQLLVLDAERAAPITLYVNSPGGSVDAGFAIYDAMQSLRNDVATVCVGVAASMGQFLLTGGTAGKRHVAPHARVLMHQPHGAVQGFASDIEIQAEQFEYLRRQLAELTAQHTGQPIERVIADADRDKWFTAAEAVEYGLADHIVVPSYIKP